MNDSISSKDLDGRGSRDAAYGQPNMSLTTAPANALATPKEAAIAHDSYASHNYPRWRSLGLDDARAELRLVSAPAFEPGQ
jgi:hypothetical protein